MEEEVARLLNKQDVICTGPCLSIESTIDEDEPSIVAEEDFSEDTWARLLRPRGRQSSVSRDGSCATTPSSVRGGCATRRSSRSSLGTSYSPARGRRSSSQAADGSPVQSAGRCRRASSMNIPSSADTTVASTPRSGGSSVRGTPHVPSRNPSRSRKNSMARTCTLVPESQMKPPPTPGLFKTDSGFQSRRSSISRRVPASPQVKQKQQCSQQASDGNVDPPRCSPHLPCRRTYIQPARSTIVSRAPGLKALDLRPEACRINIERPQSVWPVVRGCSGTATACQTTETRQWHVAVEICAPATPVVTPVLPWHMPNAGGVSVVLQRAQEPRSPCQQVAGIQGCRHNELLEQQPAAATAAAAAPVNCGQCNGVPQNLGLRASTTIRSQPIMMAGVGMQRPLTSHLRQI